MWLSSLQGPPRKGKTRSLSVPAGRQHASHCSTAMLCCAWPVNIVVIPAGPSRHRQDQEPAGVHRADGDQQACPPHYPPAGMHGHQRCCGQYCGGLGQEGHQGGQAGSACQGQAPFAHLLCSESSRPFRQGVSRPLTHKLSSCCVLWRPVVLALVSKISKKLSSFCVVWRPEQRSLARNKTHPTTRSPALHQSRPSSI